MILEKIAQSARKRVEAAKAKTGMAEIERLAINSARPENFLFEKALGKPGISFICELKKASPSKGLLSADFPYMEIARDYEAAGASAISVLTEPEFFLGSLEYLKEVSEKVSLPTLRKDFCVDMYQIYEARIYGAKALLLICSLLEAEDLKKYVSLAHSLGLSCLVEAHDESEIEKALEAGSRIIGVNNRDLRTFEVDLGTSKRLRKLVPKDILFVAESGVNSREDVLFLAEAGIDAVLVGESLIKSDNRRSFLRRLADD
ncbi:MAG: indole-3-glycerol phosphate synthase TrpC [Clostridiales bacterium]|jgi:indole-3-glycerol phosphate synthase|nr:indole-3-glycerol phosphate synthase TrpC [Clostridiales bacterium]